MKFSLLTLLMLVTVLGTIPFWVDNFLIPFFIIIIVSVVMAVRGFSDTSDDDG
ncbi:MAG: hypothetical protein R3C53_02190 [Pirellulaceae bacterium]